VAAIVQVHGHEAHGIPWYATKNASGGEGSSKFLKSCN
jgi:hypothetical protein